MTFGIRGEKPRVSSVLWAIPKRAEQKFSKEMRRER
jgi:hypothetical protein